MNAQKSNVSTGRGRLWQLLAHGLFALVLSLAGITTANAAGLLTPADGSKPALDILDHEVSVVIEDGYAITTVEQVFHNPNGQDLEAIYSFPVPAKAAVSEFTYWIDGKPVTGEVLPKQKAREVYENEKAAGHETAITEQDEYRTFDISVWPVRAGKDVRIRLAYIQPAHVDTGIGRYVYPLEEGGVDELKLAFWTANEKVSRRFKFSLELRAAYPVAALRLPSHPQAVISQTPEGYWRATIDNGVPSGAANAQAAEGGAPAQAAAPAVAHRLDKDIVVYWRHAQNLPGRVDLVAHRPAGKDRGTFMLVLTPGVDLKPITEGRDWVFVLDASGSMQRKFATLVEGVSRGLKKLTPQDRFRLIVFNNDAHELTRGFTNATREEIDRFAEALGHVTPSGGTNLYAGIAQGLRGLDADRTSGLVLVTDGVANVGVVAQKKFLDLVDKQDVRLFTAIMGNSANRPLLKAISKRSGGSAVNISNSDDIIGALLSVTSKLSHEALHHVDVKIKGVKTSDVTPAVIGSLYRGQQLVLFGHYWGHGPADLRIDAKISGRDVRYQTRFDFPETATRNPEIERLWAYASIEQLNAEIDDFGEEADLKQAATDLAVEYGLVTRYTSMVVVRDEVFKSLGIARTNRDRLKVEYAARQQRAAGPVHARRVDRSQPAFAHNQPSYGTGGGSTGGGGSGGGAFGPLAAVLTLLMVLITVRVVRRHRGAAA